MKKEIKVHIIEIVVRVLCGKDYERIKMGNRKTGKKFELIKDSKFL